MDDINNNTLTTDNGLLQLKPETSRDEQLAFIDTLREIQETQNQEIQDATHALGTDVAPRYGGLSGTNSYWLNQYQTPQTEARIASLRSAAQSSALQTALNNYLGRLQEQYSQAYRKAKKRSNSPGGNGGGDDLDNVNTEASQEGVSQNVAGWSPANKNQPQGGTIDTKNGSGYQYQYNNNGNIIWTDDPNYKRQSNGYFKLDTGAGRQLNSWWDAYKLVNPLALGADIAVQSVGKLFGR